MEQLPSELSGLAGEIYVLFPWGSLLRAVACGDVVVLKGLRRICTPGALLQILVGLDVEKDRSEIRRLRLPELSREYVETTLLPRYREAGFDLLRKDSSPLTDLAQIPSTWAKRLRHSAGRFFFHLIVKAA